MCRNDPGFIQFEANPDEHSLSRVTSGHFEHTFNFIPTAKYVLQTCLRSVFHMVIEVVMK